MFVHVLVLVCVMFKALFKVDTLEDGDVFFLFFFLQQLSTTDGTTDRIRPSFWQAVQSKLLFQSHLLQSSPATYTC